MYLCICTHIHVGVGNGLNELEGIIVSPTSVKERMWTLNENDDDDDDDYI